MNTEELLLLMKTIPVKKRGIVREHKMYKVYLPIDYNDLWEELYEKKVKLDVAVLIPRVEDQVKPDILKLVDKIVVRNRTVIREHNRFKLYLPKGFNDIWEYLNKKEVKVDLVLIPVTVE